MGQYSRKAIKNSKSSSKCCNNTLPKCCKDASNTSHTQSMFTGFINLFCNGYIKLSLGHDEESNTQINNSNTQINNSIELCDQSQINNSPMH